MSERKETNWYPTAKMLPHSGIIVWGMDTSGVVVKLVLGHDGYWRYATGGTYPSYPDFWKEVDYAGE